MARNLSLMRESKTRWARISRPSTDCTCAKAPPPHWVSNIHTVVGMHRARATYKGDVRELGVVDEGLHSTVEAAHGGFTGHNHRRLRVCGGDHTHTTPTTGSL